MTTSFAGQAGTQWQSRCSPQALADTGICDDRDEEPACGLFGIETSNTHAVRLQVGDQLDRGDSEIEILYAFERLQREAKQAGGAFHVLNGNHETMNVAQDMRYGTAGASQGLARMADVQKVATGIKQKCKCDAGWVQVPKQKPSRARHASFVSC